MGNIEDSEYANWSDRDLLAEIERLQGQLSRVEAGLGKLAAFIRPGTPVWYESSPGKRFAAVVDSEPRELGGGQWCVRLRDLDEDYQKYDASGRTTVSAAATWCLSPRGGSDSDDRPSDRSIDERHPMLAAAIRADAAGFPGLDNRDDHGGPANDDNRKAWRATIRDRLAAHKPSAAADFDAQRFVECDACGKKPGSPTLCGGCLANRQTIDELRDRRAELTLQIVELKKQSSTQLTDLRERFEDLGKAHRASVDREIAQSKVVGDLERQLVEAKAPKPKYAGQPERCPVCEWSNGDLLNYGEAGKPRWMCHPCAARAIGERMAALSDGERESLVDAQGCIRGHCGNTDKHHVRALAAISQILNRSAQTYRDSPQTGRSDSPPGAQVAVSNTDTLDLKAAATLSMVELAYRLFERIPGGLDWDGSHEWRIGVGVWKQRYHAMLGAQPPPPEIKHRFALARTRAGLSISQAAKILGVGRQDVETSEESPYKPERDALFVKQMAEKYQVNIPWLLGETPLRDYTAMAGARGYENVSDHDRDVIAEFAASMPRGTVSKKAQELRDKIRGAELPPPEEAHAALKTLLGEDE